MARSVAELLPRRFDDLSTEDVEKILRDAADPGESLFLEWKRKLTGEGVAKACAAFANTYGGLLVVGAHDETREAVGIPRPTVEPQVWIKDVLRSHVLPMPPFRARFLELAGDQKKGLLIVLVEQSSTTPHLMTRAGVIYVRNPGSSDPVPIGDQGRLFDLMRRGEQARETATIRAYQILEHSFEPVTPFKLTVVPTGVQTDVVHALYTADLPIAAVEGAVVSNENVQCAKHRVAKVTSRGARWSQNRLEVACELTQSISDNPPRFLDGVVVHQDCAIAFQRAYLPLDQSEALEPRGPRPVYLDDQVLPWISSALARGRELVLALGGHGDLRLVVRLYLRGRYVFYADNQAEVARDEIDLIHWMPIDPDPEGDLGRLSHMRATIRRSLGVRPHN
jgi:schlafen family protein